MDWDQLAGKQHCWAQPGKPGGCKKLNINQHCGMAANTVSNFLGCIYSTPRRLRDLAFIRTHLHLPLDTSDKRTIVLNGENSVESCQNAQGVEEFVLRQGLRELGLFSLARGVSMGNLVLMETELVKKMEPGSPGGVVWEWGAMQLKWS